MTRNPKRPRAFIGSSAEGLKIAQAVQQNLDYVCEVTLWCQGVFGLGDATLEALLDQIHEFDFAVLVLTPDDLVLSREAEQPSPRDNVLLELGMFLGVLGRQRAFVLFDRTCNLKLPSDMAGVICATFQLHTSGNLRASLGSATTQIQEAIEKHGTIQRVSDSLVDETAQFKVIHGLIDRVAEQFIVHMFETNATLSGSDDVGNSIKYECSFGGTFSTGHFSTSKFRRTLAESGLISIDLHLRISLTERGREFAKWIVDNNYKAPYFNSDVCQWGERPQHPWPWRDLPRLHPGLVP